MSDREREISFFPILAYSYHTVNTYLTAESSFSLVFQLTGKIFAPVVEYNRINQKRLYKRPSCNCFQYVFILAKYYSSLFLDYMVVIISGLYRGLTNIHRKTFDCVFGSSKMAQIIIFVGFEQ